MKSSYDYRWQESFLRKEQELVADSAEHWKYLNRAWDRAVAAQKPERLFFLRFKMLEFHERHGQIGTARKMVSELIPYVQYREPELLLMDAHFIVHHLAFPKGALALLEAWLDSKEVFDEDRSYRRASICLYRLELILMTSSSRRRVERAIWDAVRALLDSEVGSDPVLNIVRMMEEKWPEKTTSLLPLLMERIGFLEVQKAVMDRPSEELPYLTQVARKSWQEWERLLEKPDG